jgi:hypothetical protein
LSNHPIPCGIYDTASRRHNRSWVQLAAPLTDSRSIKRMRWYSKLVVAALAATALFASLAGSASARNFSLTNSNIRVVFEPLRFIGSFGPEVRCRVTLEGSFHCATISKVAERLLGYITRAIVDQPGCTTSPAGEGEAGEVRAETLPWHIRYVSFAGTLPRVTIRVRLIGATFTILNVPVLGTCRYRANPDGIVTGPAGNEITEGNASLTAEENPEFNSETFGCPRGRFGGRAPVWLLGTTNGIRVRLT